MIVEHFIAWVLLFVAVFSGDANWFIASGVFAVAGNLNTKAKAKGERENDTTGSNSTDKKAQ